MVEISLIEWVEAILKRKWTIISVSLICIMLSGLLSYFVMETVYESSSTFMITPIEIESGIMQKMAIIYVDGDSKNEDNTRILKDRITKSSQSQIVLPWMENKILGATLKQIRYPNLDESKVFILMNSVEYKKRVMNQLNIDLKEYSFSENIKISLDEKSFLFTVDVRHNDALTAQRIKKTLIEDLPEYLSTQVKNQLVVIEGLIDQGIDRETADIVKWDQELANLVGVSGAIDKLSTEKQGEYQKIKNNYTLSTQALEAFQIIKKEFDYIKNTNIREMTNLQVIEESNPSNPVSPRIKLNLAVAVILSIMICMFYIYLMLCWEKRRKVTLLQ